ncbi:hypothetical protein [Mesorhizobium sp. 8]|uniref:hypothetical protein n=1 Tax=Mesorhizobium sp. 8 TaxID=2584466 RepID=UPI0011213EC2|nr:hypothetical protein [Mesorhizobium sp. 8]QDB99519.1 hypothetical protein FGU64_03375 [Mesorhizobium sp. 8]
MDARHDGNSVDPDGSDGTPDGDGDADEDEDGDDELEKAEKLYEEMVAACDQSLNRWKEAATPEVQQAAVDHFAETGELNAELAGVDPIEAEMVHAAFYQYVERNVLKPFGLTVATWQEHIDPAEEPAFRRAMAKGDWALLKHHANRAAAMRREHGLMK